MKRHVAYFLAAVLLVSGCREDRPNGARIAAARMLTQLYRRPVAASWRVRATAAGKDCSVLFVQTPLVLEDSLVEALQYGAGPGDVYRGGAQQFSQERTFRGVAYRDGTGHVWAYGSVTTDEAERLLPCR